MIKKILILLSIAAVFASQIIFSMQAGASATWPKSGTYSNGYFTNRAHNGASRGRVLDRGLTGCSGCINGRTLDKEAFISYISGIAAGSNDDATGAKYIIASMIGVRSEPTSKDIEKWKEIIRSDEVIGKRETIEHTVNTGIANDIKDIVWWQEGASSVDGIVFYQKGVNKYEIKMACANPIGGMGFDEPKKGWELTPASSIKKEGGDWQSGNINVKPNDKVVYSHSITNAADSSTPVGGFTGTVNWSGNKSGQAATGNVTMASPLAPGKKIFIPASPYFGFTIPADAQKGQKFCQNITSSASSSETKGKSVSSTAVCAVVDIPTNGDWYLAGACSVDIAQAKPGQTVNFAHTLSNPSKKDVSGAAWSVAKSTGGSKSGSATIKAGVKNMQLYKDSYKIPSGFSGTVTQTLTYPSEKGKTATSKCTVTVGPGSNTPAPGMQNADTSYDGVEPLLPGEVGKWTHTLTDTTYPEDKVTITWTKNASDWSSIVNTEWYSWIDLRFYQDTPADTQDFWLSDGATGARIIRKDHYAQVPNPFKVGANRNVLESDIGKNFCHRFEYDMWTHRYKLIEKDVPDYKTVKDKNGKWVTVQVGSHKEYSVQVLPDVKVYTKGSTQKCVEVGKRPKVQFWGGDVRSRGDVSGSLMQPWLYENRADKDSVFGSWAEYGIFAAGKVNSLASAAHFLAVNENRVKSYVADDSWHKLTFANTGTYGNFTGMPSRSLALIDQFSARNENFSGSPGDLSSAQSGLYKGNSMNIGGGTVGAGKSIVVVSNGDVDITGDINYANYGGDPNQVPGMVIIANGDIKIADSVRNIDAWLLSRSGTVNTCASASQAEDLTLRDCTQPLRLNGPISANKLLLHRTAYSEKGSSDQPAEVLNLRGDAYIWARRFQSSTGKVTTVDTRELPPRF